VKNEFDSFNTAGLTPSSLTFKNNAYYALNGGTFNLSYGGTTYTNLSSWQAVAPGGETGATTANPQLTSGGNGGTCGGWNSSCPSAYELLHGSPLIGIGLDLTQGPYSLSVGSQDYYGDTTPNGTGTGYNVGADGAAR
jgi:hypothetical protein